MSESNNVKGISGGEAWLAVWNMAFMALITTASLIVWAALAARARQHRPFLQCEPRRPVPWQWPEVAIAFLLFLLLPQLVGAVLQWGWGAAPKGVGRAAADHLLTPGMLAVNEAATLAAMLLVAKLIRQQYQATAADLGLARGHTVGDIRVGFVAFLSVAAAVYWIKLLLTPLTRVEHPLVELLTQHPSKWLFVEVAVAAVLIAPVVEEFLFRVILQGWLEKALPQLIDDDELPGDACGSHEATARPRAGADRWTWRSALPIFISAEIFAACHFGNGLDPIPLFVLALVLGYLYQRTHRILPGLVVHMSLNAATMLLLALKMAS